MPVISKKEPSERPAEVAIDNAGFQRLDNEENREARRQFTQRMRQRLSDANVACLIGSGVSMGEGGPSMGHLWNRATQIAGFDDARKATSYPDSRSDIEEFLSYCQMAIQLNRAAKDLPDFVGSVQAMITSECRDFKYKNPSLDDHVKLLRHLTSRSVETSRPTVFTTNYDRCIEEAAVNAGLPIIDGFSLQPPHRFDGRNFDIDFVRRVINQKEPAYVEGVFTLCKLHGSVNWNRCEGFVERGGQPEQGLMIFPRDNKFEQSYQQPFLEMMSRFQTTLRQPNTTLFVLGFGFNDNHLSEPILSALRTNPQFNLVVATRSLQIAATGDPSNNRGPNVHLSQLVSSVKQGLPTVTLVDSDFRQFLDLFPSVEKMSDEQRLMELARKVFQPVAKP